MDSPAAPKKKGFMSKMRNVFKRKKKKDKLAEDQTEQSSSPVPPSGKPPPPSSAPGPVRLTLQRSAAKYAAPITAKATGGSDGSSGSHEIKQVFVWYKKPVGVERSDVNGLVKLCVNTSGDYTPSIGELGCEIACQWVEYSEVVPEGGGPAKKVVARRSNMAFTSTLQMEDSVATACGRLLKEGKGTFFVTSCNSYGVNGVYKLHVTESQVKLIPEDNPPKSGSPSAAPAAPRKTVTLPFEKDWYLTATQAHVSSQKFVLCVRTKSAGGAGVRKWHGQCLSRVLRDVLYLLVQKMRVRWNAKHSDDGSTSQVAGGPATLKAQMQETKTGARTEPLQNVERKTVASPTDSGQPDHKDALVDTTAPPAQTEVSGDETGPSGAASSAEVATLTPPLPTGGPSASDQNNTPPLPTGSPALLVESPSGDVNSSPALSKQSGEQDVWGSVADENQDDNPFVQKDGTATSTATSTTTVVAGLDSPSEALSSPKVQQAAIDLADNPFIASTSDDFSIFNTDFSGTGPADKTAPQPAEVGDGSGGGGEQQPSGAEPLISAFLDDGASDKDAMEQPFLSKRAVSSDDLQERDAGASGGAELASLRAELKAMESKTERYQQELRHQATSWQAERIRLEEERDRNLIERDRLAAQVDRLTAASENSSRQSSSQQAAAAQRVAALEQQLTQLQESLDVQQETHAGELRAAQQNQADMQARLDALSSSSSDRENELAATAEQAQKELGKLQKALEKKDAAAEKAQNKWQARWDKRERQVISDKEKAARKALDALQSATNRHEKQMAAEQAKWQAQLSKQQDVEQSLRAELTSAQDGAQQERSSLQQELETARAEAVAEQLTARSALETAREETAQAVKRAEEAEQAVSSAQAERDAVSASLEELRAQHQQLQTQNETAASKLAAEVKARAQSEEMATHLRTTVESMEQELQTLRGGKEQAESVREQFDTLQAQNESLTTEVSELRASLEQEQTARAEAEAQQQDTAAELEKAREEAQQKFAKSQAELQKLRNSHTRLVTQRNLVQQEVAKLKRQLHQEMGELTATPPPVTGRESSVSVDGQGSGTGVPPSRVRSGSAQVSPGGNQEVTQLRRDLAESRKVISLLKKSMEAQTKRRGAGFSAQAGRNAMVEGQAQQIIVTLTETVTDKETQLQHQRQVNRALGRRVLELEELCKANQVEVKAWTQPTSSPLIISTQETGPGSPSVGSNEDHKTQPSASPSPPRSRSSSSARSPQPPSNPRPPSSSAPRSPMPPRGPAPPKH